MTAYIIRRILLMIPTLLGIMLVSFIVVQFAPGGPVERIIAQLSGSDTGATSRFSGTPGGDFGTRFLDDVVVAGLAVRDDIVPVLRACSFRRLRNRRDRNDKNVALSDRTIGDEFHYVRASSAFRTCVSTP